jgi:S-adenosylmethionine synthetase
MVLGEITTNAFVNFDDLVRRVVKEIGYDNTDKGFDGNTCAVLSAIASQSGDIAMGVDKALEAKAGEMTDAADRSGWRGRSGHDVWLCLQ